MGAAIAEAVLVILRALASTGVSPEELETVKQEALASIAAIRSDQLAQEAKEWRIAQGEES
jgi:hypothetical protein